MGDVNTAYKNNELVPLLVATAGGLLTWLGYEGQTVFAAHLPTFWKSTGSLISITSGIFAAIYAGYATVDAAVKSEYWKKTGTSSAYVGANFLRYGGNGWMSGTLGAIEVTWVIAFLSLGIEIVVMPLLIATEMDKYYAAKYEAANTAANKAQFDWFSLGLAFLTAFGSWTSALALKNSTTRLINFFDIQDTDAVARYKAAFGGSNPTFDNSIALLADLGLHSLTVLFYYILALAISNCAYWFSYTTIQAQNA
jgi:hypothetical protein